MTSEQLQSKWHMLKGRIREQWHRLSDVDVEMIAGQRDLLIRKLQERYGVTKEVATRDADAWLKLNGASAAHDHHLQHAGRH